MPGDTAENMKKLGMISSGSEKAFSGLTPGLTPTQQGKPVFRPLGCMNKEQARMYEDMPASGVPGYNPKPVSY